MKNHPTPTPPRRAEVPQLPLEDLDHPELDEDEPETLRSPVPDWSDESGVSYRTREPEPVRERVG